MSYAQVKKGEAMDKRRQLEILEKTARHLLALVYLVCELVTGEKPSKLLKDREDRGWRDV